MHSPVLDEHYVVDATFAPKVRARGARRKAYVLAVVVLAACVTVGLLRLRSDGTTSTAISGAGPALSSPATSSVVTTEAQTASPEGAQALTDAMSTVTTIASVSTLSLGKDSREWSVVVRTDAAHDLSNGFCIDIRPNGGSYCATGTDGRLGPILETKSPYHLVAIEAPAGATAMEVTSPNGTVHRATVANPFSDSKVGFAATEISSADTSYHLRALDAGGNTLAEIANGGLPRP